MKASSLIARTLCPNTMAGRLRTACAARLLTLLLLTLPSVVQAQFTYTTDNGTITITKYTGSGGAVSIPSSINGLPVTSIGGNAFYDCTSLTGVTIGTNVTSIENYAFYDCTKLTSVTIPNSVTTIGVDAFRKCSSLTAITVDSLNPVYSSVAGVLFNKSQTTLIQYPGAKAGSYTIPNSVTNVGDWAFAGYTSLTSVTIPNSVTSIGGGAFEYCTSLTSVTIPNSVTSIGRDAFSYCQSLTSVTIGNGVTNIGKLAFFNCKNLTGVYFKGNAPSVGSSAFDDKFAGDNNATVYYLPGNTGWGSTFGGCPVVLWKP